MSTLSWPSVCHNNGMYRAYPNHLLENPGRLTRTRNHMVPGGWTANDLALPLLSLCQHLHCLFRAHITRRAKPRLRAPRFGETFAAPGDLVIRRVPARRDHDPSPVQRWARPTSNR